MDTIHITSFCLSAITNDAYLWIGEAPEDGPQQRPGPLEIIVVLNAEAYDATLRVCREKIEGLI